MIPFTLSFNNVVLSCLGYVNTYHKKKKNSTCSFRQYFNVSFTKERNPEQKSFWWTFNVYNDDDDDDDNDDDDDCDDDGDDDGDDDDDDDDDNEDHDDDDDDDDDNHDARHLHPRDKVYLY